MKILIVDDSAMMLAIVRRWCVTLGVREDDIVEATNGQIALDRFAADSFDASSPTGACLSWMDGLSSKKFASGLRTFPF